MNEIVDEFLLVGDKFMSEMHLKQPGFTYSAYGPFTKNRQRIEEFMQTESTSFIYKNKACFQHDMAYGDFNDLVKRTQLDKVLKDKAFKIRSDPKYEGFQKGLASMVYKFFDKKSTSLNKSKGRGIIASIANKSANEPNYQLANELHKPTIKNFKKRKVYSFFIDNIWGVDLANMQSLSKYNKRIKYLLCTIDLFSRYAWVVPLKDKKGVSTVNAFEKILSDSNSSEAKSKGRKASKIWVDQGSEFYNNSFKGF